MSLATPLYAGADTNVDERFDLSIGGHGYMIDDKYIDDFGRQTVDMIRQQADTGDRPAEQSLNPAGTWPRAIESWHLGAGQTWFDRPESSQFRFLASKGVDPWTRLALSLLPDTTGIGSSANTNLHLAVGGGRLYYADGAGIRVSGIGNTTFAAATAVPAQTVSSMTSSGSHVYAAFTAGGVGIWFATGTAFAQYVTTDTFTLVRHVMGRLLAFDSIGAVYNILATGPRPTALFTHPLGTSWTWTDATDGQTCIYASGYAGDRGAIYRIGLGTDATVLDVPILAAPLPDGELPMSLQGYLGYVVIGTSKGVRFALPQQDGSLMLGSLIPTPTSVLCSEGQDRFVWFGWTNYDAASTGLGRLDLRNFTDDFTPAYASDLMASAQGIVRSVVTYNDKRIFSVSGVGVFQESANKVTSGTVNSGRITFGLPYTKTAVELNVRHDRLPVGAEVELSLARDGDAPVILGTSDAQDTVQSSPGVFNLNQATATFYEITATLSGGPVLRRITLEVDPAATRTVIYQAPLRLFDKIDLPGGVPHDVDVRGEFDYLFGLLRSRTLVNYQDGGDSMRVVVENFTWKPEKRGMQFWQGCLIVRMKGL